MNCDANQKEYYFVEMNLAVILFLENSKLF